MDAMKIGQVEGGSGKTFDVWWDSASNNLYVLYTGTLDANAAGGDAPVGNARSAGEAMRKAEELVVDQ